MSLITDIFTLYIRSPVHLITGDPSAIAVQLQEYFSLRFCIRPSDTRGCGSCYACEQIAKQTHPALMWIRPEPGREILKESVNELTSALALTSDSPSPDSLGSIAIIEHADQLSPASGNLLLKSLEEPPAHWTIILTSAYPQRILPTIRSRCMHHSMSDSAGTLSPLLTALATSIDPLKPLDLRVQEMLRLNELTQSYTCSSSDIRLLYTVVGRLLVNTDMLEKSNEYLEAGVHIKLLLRAIVASSFSTHSSA